MARRSNMEKLFAFEGGTDVPGETDFGGDHPRA